jgi:transcriptional regulator with XRE-family HTH domain
MADHRVMEAANTKMSLRERLAQNLRDIRIARGISQERLGELAGFHRTYVSHVERAVTNVSLDNLEKLAGALGVDPLELLRSV